MRRVWILLFLALGISLLPALGCPVGTAEMDGCRRMCAPLGVRFFTNDRCECAPAAPAPPSPDGGAHAG